MRRVCKAGPQRPTGQVPGDRSAPPLSRSIPNGPWLRPVPHPPVRVGSTISPTCGQWLVRRNAAWQASRRKDCLLRPLFASLDGGQQSVVITRQREESLMYIGIGTIVVIVIIVLVVLALRR
jgi:hypothetical protein